MRSKTPPILWLWLLIGLLVSTPIALVEAQLAQSLCSSQNTGADSQILTDNYQSNGKCFDNCKANYAFAVVQGKNCWCSNYAPADTTSIGTCNSVCPGYGFENCGSSTFYGYIALNKAPLGTIGASQSQEATSSSPIEVATSSPQVAPPTPQPVTVQQTVTASPSVQISLVSVTPSTTPETIPETTTETTTTSTPAKASTRFVPVPVFESTTSSTPTTSSTSSTSSASSSSSTKSTWTPTPITSIMTVTGQVTTITITPTAPPTSAAIAQSSDGGFMSHPGKVAGLFVGVALIICLIAGALIWFFLRRKRHAEAETIASITGEETPQRRVSKLSTMGLLGGTGRSNNRKSVPAIQTSGWGPGNTSTEKSPTDTPIDYRRTSYPRIVDQRLEPTALWNPLQDNRSHVSIQSFQDDQDYSRRMLRVANPDDRPISRD